MFVCCVFFFFSSSPWVGRGFRKRQLSFPRRPPFCVLYGSSISHVTKFFLFFFLAHTFFCFLCVCYWLVHLASGVGSVILRRYQQSHRAYVRWNCCLYCCMFMFCLFYTVSLEDRIYIWRRYHWDVQYSTKHSAFMGKHGTVCRIIVCSTLGISFVEICYGGECRLHVRCS